MVAEPRRVRERGERRKTGREGEKRVGRVGRGGEREGRDGGMEGNARMGGVRELTNTWSMY